MVNSEEIIFRSVKVEDLQELVELMKAHADFEELEFAYSNQEERLKKKIFDEKAPLFCLVAEYKRQLIGYASFIKQYSTWEANDYLYLDCLYFDEEYRGMGLGSKMMELIKIEARKLGCQLIQWQTPSFNQKAIDFYHKMGSSSKSKERFFLEV